MRELSRIVVIIIIIIVSCTSSCISDDIIEPKSDSRNNSNISENVTPLSELDAWIMDHPKIMNAIKWNNIPYHKWVDEWKQDLYQVFLSVRNKEPSKLSDPLMNWRTLRDDETVSTSILKEEAWQLYLETISFSLVAEIENLLPWSILDENPGEIEILFDSSYLFYGDEYLADDGKNHIIKVYGFLTPSIPEICMNFLVDNHIIGETRLDTISNIIEWCNKLNHIGGGSDTKNVVNYWQYRGKPPVSKIINGTIRNDNINPTVQNYTGGCGYTTFFIQHVLRVINIPVKHVNAGGHSRTYFTSEEKFLAHGDDPYGVDPIIPPDSWGELLVDQNTIDSWYINKTEQEKEEMPVSFGDSLFEIKYLDWNQLYYHCKDKIRHITDHEKTMIYLNLQRDFTVTQLEDLEVWKRLDQVLEATDGCSCVLSSRYGFKVKTDCLKKTINVLPIPESINSMKVSPSVIPRARKKGVELNHAIIINSEEDCNHENGIVDGTGTQNDPYIISGWRMWSKNQSDSSIKISNTDCYIILRDLYIGEKGNITLDNASNIKIENVEIYQGEGTARINVDKCSNIDINNCFITVIGYNYISNVKNGINMTNSRYVNLTNNHINSMFFASGNSPLLQNIFPRRRWGILYIHNVRASFTKEIIQEAFSVTARRYPVRYIL